MAKKRISIPKDKSEEIKKKKENVGKYEPSRDLDDIRRWNIYLLGVSIIKNKENGVEVVFKDRETKNFFIDFCCCCCGWLKTLVLRLKKLKKILYGWAWNHFMLN